MKYQPWKLRIGYAGLGVAAVTACVAAGLAPLTPVLIVGAIYGIRRWSPIHARMEQREQDRISERYTELPDNHPLQKRVAQIAARMDSPVPRVFLAPPRTDEINVYAVGNISRAGGTGGFLVLPATMFVTTRPGVAPAFTPAEQDAVIAHEMSHIKHRDSHKMLLASATQNMAMLGYAMACVGALLGVVATGPLWVATGAALSAMALSRMAQRQVEYRADVEATAASGNALALATSLEKLERTGRHLNAFAQNAREITQDNSERGWLTTFRPRPVHNAGDDIYRKPEFSPLTRFLVRFLSTHPERGLRYQHLRERAVAEGQAPLPVRPPSVEREMAPYLLRTADGIVLPPFAIPETLVRERDSDRMGVATGVKSVFNAAARGDLPPPSSPKLPLRRPDNGPSAPGPWG